MASILDVSTGRGYVTMNRYLPKINFGHSRNYRKERD